MRRVRLDSMSASADHARYPPGVACHSKKALAGMMQRWERSGRRNDGLLSIPSARALISCDPTRGSFAHAGTSPHLISASS